jgi:hypothetical protein
MQDPENFHYILANAIYEQKWHASELCQRLDAFVQTCSDATRLRRALVLFRVVADRDEVVGRWFCQRVRI